MSNFNNFIAVSDNSINENKFNESKKSSTKIYQLKTRIIKPLLEKLRRKSKKNSYRQSPQPNYFVDEEQSEIDDNLANELLENEIFEEIDSCDEYAAVPVYHNGHMDITPVFRGQRYIPVHFARTQAGTFFWTSMFGADSDIDSHGDENPITNYQKPELQSSATYRWAQA